MAQFARPDTDANNPDGFTTQAGGTTSLFATLDETVADDADYVRSVLTPTSDVYVAGLSNVEDPQASTGHVLRVRYAKDAAGGAQIDLTVQLRQGYVSEASLGTLIATRSFTNVAETFTTDAYTLSAAEADAITNYADLYVRVVANQV